MLGAHSASTETIIQTYTLSREKTTVFVQCSSGSGYESKLSSGPRTLFPSPLTQIYLKVHYTTLTAHIAGILCIYIYCSTAGSVCTWMDIYCTVYIYRESLRVIVQSSGHCGFCKVFGSLCQNCGLCTYTISLFTVKKNICCVYVQCVCVESKIIVKQRWLPSFARVSLTREHRNR
jgi:hypothetical protein